MIKGYPIKSLDNQAIQKFLINNLRQIQLRKKARSKDQIIFNKSLDQIKKKATHLFHHQNTIKPTTRQSQYIYLPINQFKQTQLLLNRRVRTQPSNTDSIKKRTKRNNKIMKNQIINCQGKKKLHHTAQSFFKRQKLINFQLNKLASTNKQISSRENLNRQDQNKKLHFKASSTKFKNIRASNQYRKNGLTIQKKSVQKQWSVFTIKGTEKMINQDKYFGKRYANIQIFGIFDGHGKHGHIISQQVSRQLPQILNQNINILRKSSEISQSINRSFQILIERLDTNRFQYSGCTACVIIIISNINLQENKLFCANVGDSRAILIDNDQAIQVISRQHKPNYPMEKARIQGYGGLVYSKRQNGRNIGPIRVWSPQGDGIGLSVSRTIGDFNATKYGVIGQPEITQYLLSEQYSHVIIGSDGLFELLKLQTVSVKCLLPIDRLCMMLCKQSEQLWVKKYGQSDDITCLCIKLK